MKVKIWTYKSKKLVFEGELETIPRKGELLIFDNDIEGYQVEDVFHHIPGNLIEIVLVLDNQESFKDIRFG